MADLVKRYGCIFTLPENHPVIKRMRAFKGLESTVQVLSPLNAAGLVMSIFTGVSDRLEKGILDNPYSELVGQAQSLIVENMAEPISITEIADKMQVSREHLSRAFRRQIDASPQEYIIRVKMQFAQDILRNTSYSCKEIAERVGYDSPSCFNRAFKRVYGMTPQTMRKSGIIPE